MTMARTPSSPRPSRPERRSEWRYRPECCPPPLPPPRGGGSQVRLRLSIFALLGLLASAPAAADITIRYAPDPPGERPLLVEADQEGRIRAEIGPGQLLLMRDSDIFVVTPGADGP